MSVSYLDAPDYAEAAVLDGSVFGVGLTFESWGERAAAAREYLRRRPWTPRRPFFESVLRAASALSPPVAAAPRCPSGPAPFGGGRPTGASLGARSAAA